MKIEEWKKLIAQDNLDDLFADLMIYFYSTDLESIIISLKSNHKSLIKERIKGVISYADFRIESNKIKNRILDFFSEYKEEISHIIPSEKNKPISHEDTETTDIISDEKNESDILEIVKSINRAKSESNTSDVAKKLLELQNVFYNIDKVVNSINLSEFGEQERQELMTLFDKSIRRIKQARILTAISYDRHIIFYKSYLGEMKKLISLLDIPKSSYSKTEINVLKDVKKSLNTSLKYIDGKKSNQNNYREKTTSGINGLKGIFQIMNETVLLDKLMVVKNEAEKLFDDIEMYNPLLIYKKDDLLPLYNEIKISIVEIENK